MKEIEAKELKSLQLQILQYVDEFCKGNGVKYFMCGGSLIGAVRHKGYIPWDDDIDIMMLREDYNYFIRLFSSKKTYPYSVHCYINDPNYIYPFAKVEDSRTIIKTFTEHDNQIGVNIDVFPIDRVPNGVIHQTWMYLRVRFYLSIFNLKDLSIREGRQIWKNCLISIAHFVLRSVKYYSLANRINSIAVKYTNDNTNRCGIVVWGYGMREINKLSNFDTILESMFESLIVPIPIGYDNYLCSVYGNYMQLPPEEKRVTHHSFTAWWK